MSTINLDDDQRIEEIYKLTKDTNRMLHAMRRDAFLHGLLKFVIYAIVVAITLWTYVHYIGPMLVNVLKSMQAVASTGTEVQQKAGNIQQNAQQQLSQVTDMLNKVQDQIKSLPGGSQ